MIIDISKLPKDETIEYVGLKMPDDVQILSEFDAKATNIVVDVMLTKFNKSVLAEGTIDADIIGPCVRCNSNSIEKLSIKFSEVFYKNNEILEEDAYGFSGNAIDLEPLVDDLIIVNFSGKLLCKSDCKGLCDKCGKNLNAGSCKCKDFAEGLINPANPMLELRKAKKLKR